MSTLTESPAPRVEPAATLRELALVDAKRYATHPLLLFGFVANAALIYAAARDRAPAPLGIAISPAFFLGVLGLVVAHRLTTSLGRSHELVDSMPSSERRRTAALCLACLVPFAAGLASAVAILVLSAAYPPELVPPHTQMAWFGDYSGVDVVAALLAIGAVASLGGPLLGILIARWAPFRGSALVAIVVIFFVCESSTHWSVPWSVSLPWTSLYDEYASHGVVTHSVMWVGVSQVWYCVYALLMCGLAAVGAMLHDPVDRRPLLWTGGALAVAAAGAFALTAA